MTYSNKNPRGNPHQQQFENERMHQYAQRMRDNPTPAELTMRHALKRRSVHEWINQYRVGTFYILDFYCPGAKVAIEVDGGYHEDPQQRQSDEDRDRRVDDQHRIKTYRIANDYVEDEDELLKFIKLVNNVCRNRKRQLHTKPLYMPWNRYGRKR